MPMLLPLALMLASVSCLMVWAGTRRSAAAISIDDRLAQYSERQYTLEELELTLPFRERVLIPSFLRFARYLSRYTPRSNVDALRQSLIEAGSPPRVGVAEFMGLRLVLSMGSAGLIFLLFAISSSSVLNLILFPVVVAVLGYMIPGIWLKRKIKSRKKAIQMALPDAIDLLTISVEAGLGFDPALQRVTDKWENALTLEFQRLLHDMRIGKSRREAMRELANRCNVDDLNVFIASIIQADQLGVSITQVLRTQSKQIRIRRRQRAQEAAYKAPIKMLFPMIFLIFPSLFAVILGPAIPRFVEAF